MAGAIGLVLALATLPARAAGVDLPPDSIGPDTIFVIRADAQRLSPDLLRGAVFSVLGENAERLNDFMAKFCERYEKATAAGVESIYVVGSSTQRVSDAEKELVPEAEGARRSRRPMNPPVVYFRVKPTVNESALEQLMTRDLSEKQKQDVRFEPMDNWVVMHQKDQTPPEKVDADRAQAFSEALASTAESAVALVVIPDARMKGEMTRASGRDGTPELAKKALPILQSSRWMSLAMTLGNNPQLSAKVNAADADGAAQLRDAASSALDKLKEQAPNQGGPMAFIAPMLTPLIEGVRPTLSGTMVGSTLKGEPLNMIANLIVMFRVGQPPATAPAPAPARP